MANGTLYYSTCLRNIFLGSPVRKPIAKLGTTLSYVKGTPDTITDSGSGFITAGFAPGMFAFTYNATTGGNDISAVEIVSVAAGTLTLATTNGLAGSEAFPATGLIVGVALADIMGALLGGVIDIFTVGSGIPASADAAVTGSLACRITVGSGSWTAGAFANGLILSPASAGSISKNSDVWSGVGLVNPSAVMSFFRWKGNATDGDAADPTFLLPRIQGTVGVGSTYDLNVSSTTLAYNATLTIDTAVFTPNAVI